MHEGEHDRRACLAREILDRVGDKWSLAVVQQLGFGTRRFTELRRAIPPISQRMLTVTLRGLERDGLIGRTVYPVVPPRVDYALTPLGLTLLETACALMRWADDHTSEIEAAREAYDNRERAAPESFTLEDADRLAERAHAGQVDKAGLPYIEHPRAVARLTRKFGGSEQQQLAALLHDTIEDTACTLEALRAAGVPPSVLQLVDALTHRPDEDQEAYLARVVATPGAALVKRADVAHNSMPERLALLDAGTQNRLRRKYAHTLQALELLVHPTPVLQASTPTDG